MTNEKLYFCPYCETDKTPDAFPPREEMSLPGICLECTAILDEVVEESTERKTLNGR